MNEGIQLNGQVAIQKAIDEIMAIRQEVGVMGGNDSEMSNFQTLMDDLRKGKLLPENAITEAMKIRYRKQDDH
jgi:hypothetical protein